MASGSVIVIGSLCVPFFLYLCGFPLVFVKVYWVKWCVYISHIVYVRVCPVMDGHLGLGIKLSRIWYWINCRETVRQCERPQTGRLSF